MERVLPDGRRQVWYKNGTFKDITKEGVSCVKFTNGDVKTQYPSSDGEDDGRTVYFYKANQTTHTTFTVTGLEVFEFPGGQTERHYPDGSKVIDFPDGTRKKVGTEGEVEVVFGDGVRVRE